VAIKLFALREVTPTPAIPRNLLNAFLNLIAPIFWNVVNSVAAPSGWPKGTDRLSNGSVTSSGFCEAWLEINSSHIYQSAPPLWCSEIRSVKDMMVATVT
jgi:hypothetical protein